ncbi:MAG: hypothetical protein JNN07_03985 [Verrucomicrobiales bacterium]|nr:hypothetical protein [Verrucomicrobiales bacterium]
MQLFGTCRFALIILLWAVPGARGLEGRVTTLQGRDLYGKIRWEGGGLVVVNSRTDTWSRVNVADIRALWLDSSDSPPLLPPASLIGQEVTATGLPFPWEMGDIGSPAGPVNVYYSGGTYRFESKFSSLGQGVDAARFVFERIRGDREFVTRIARSTPIHEQARAGMMFRSTLNESSPGIFWGTMGGTHDICEWRTAAGGPMESFSAPVLPGVRWYKLKREGDEFSAFRSRDGVRWLIVGQTNVALPSDMLMGLTAAGVSEFRGHSASFESVRHERRMVNQVPVRTELVSGSVIESSWMEIDSGGLRFSGIQARPLVRRDQVARILFHSIPGRLETRLRSGQPGVLLTTGDFIEGEVRSISEGTMVLDSVLFGQRRLDVVNLVLAVVMRPTEKPAFAYEVHTVDGSTWKALSVTMVDYGLSIQEPLIGTCVLPVSDLVSLELVR